MVGDGGRLRVERVDSGDCDSVDVDVFNVAVRCLPAWTRRRSDGGREVRRERSWRRVEIVVDAGRVSGIAIGPCKLCAIIEGQAIFVEMCLLSPDSSLTKMCMDSSVLEDVEWVEASDDDRDERMMLCDDMRLNVL